MTQLRNPAHPSPHNLVIDRCTEVVDAVSIGLQLSGAEQEASAQIKPELWVAWARSVLSNDYPGLVSPDGTPIARLDPDSPTRKLLGGFVISERRRFFDFRHGNLARNVTTLYEQQDKTSRERFDRIAMTCANLAICWGAFTGTKSKTWGQYMPQTPQTIIRPRPRNPTQASIQFPAIINGRQRTYSHAMNGPVKSIVAFQPDLTGAHSAFDMFGQVEEIHFVSGGLGAVFTNETLGQELVAIGRGVDKLRRANRLTTELGSHVSLDAQMPTAYFSREGIASGADEIAANIKGELVRAPDLVVMNVTGNRQWMTGVSRAHDLLNTGGWFVARGLWESEGDRHGVKAVVSEGRKRFDNLIASGYCGKLDYNGTDMITSRPDGFVIYQK